LLPKLACFVTNSSPVRSGEMPSGRHYLFGWGVRRRYGFRVLNPLGNFALASSSEMDGEVDVRVVWDPPWTPALMDEEAAAGLGFRTG
jgi:hypothetical protein